MKKRIILFLLLFIYSSVYSQETQNENDLLISACQKNDTTLVKYFLQEGANPNYLNSFGDFALKCAINNNNSTICSILLENGANPNGYDTQGIFPLMYASDQGRDEICKLLLDYGANPNYVSPYNNVVCALTSSIIQNYPKTADILLQYNANPNIVDSVNSYTPLFQAVYYGHLECADVLLFHGANPNQICNFRSPLQVATYFGDSIMAQLLIDYGAKINEIPDTIIFNISPLVIAIEKNDTNMVKWLLKNGADINQKCEYGTPIVYSSIFADAKMSELLLKNGANIHDLDKNGNNLTTSSILFLNPDNREYFKSKGIKNKKHFILSAVSLGFIQEFCKHEYRMGIQLGLHEALSNSSIYTAFSFRPGYCASVVKNSEHNFSQLREKLYFFHLTLEKRFSITHQKLPDAGAFVQYQFSTCSGKFDGSIDSKPENQIFHSPGIGIYQRFSGIGFSLGFKYYNFKNMINPPNKVINLSITGYFNKNHGYRNKWFIYM
ncbi:MAG: ankyrin repeat domain-containing protein [Bacteroidales bacterium]|nr:ankyrin repeat domain-containing protein [Bacteroidales bacterium]